MLLLGYDIGTSSVKAALVDAQTGKTVASAQYPDSEAPILAKQPGWAEQDPEMWWEELKQATARAAAKAGGSLADVKAIGISYQMHGLVCVDKAGKPLRPPSSGVMAVLSLMATRHLKVLAVRNVFSICSTLLATSQLPNLRG